jgi:hypothetical protein
VRVYLDNWCLNRPFDDQRQMRVRLEAEATLCIQEHIRRGTLELVWSYMLDFENAANPFEERRTTISGWRQYATRDVGAYLLVGGGHHVWEEAIESLVNPR